ncbi:17273_t:CDS:2 [Funneliformis geosporum]|nr:17273_t:CDS:2 [Funneliformis geosporum]
MGNKVSSQRYQASKLLDTNKQLTTANVIETNEKSTETKDFKYYFNNDNNIHRQHDLYFLKKHLFQCGISSPIKEKLITGCKVLDLGCGPATFLLDLAVQYPDSKFLGVDIEPLFPSEIKPKNLKFKIVDILQRLPFLDNEFDFVHTEAVLFLLPSEKIDFLINEMIRITKPNGYIEICESIFNNQSKGIGEKFGHLLHGFGLVSKLHKADIKVALKLSQMLAAKSNIHKSSVNDKLVVVGKNGGKLGVIMQDILTWFNNSSELFVVDICRQLNLTKEQYDQLVVDAFNELNFTCPEMTLRRIFVQKKG